MQRDAKIHNYFRLIKREMRDALKVPARKERERFAKNIKAEIYIYFLGKKIKTFCITSGTSFDVKVNTFKYSGLSA